MPVWCMIHRDERGNLCQFGVRCIGIRVGIYVRLPSELCCDYLFLEEISVILHDYMYLTP